MPWTCPTHPHATLLGLLLLLAPSITAQQPPPWTDSNPNYNSPMATALIVMIIVFFSVGFISVYLRHFLACLGFYPNGGTRRGGGGGWTREAPRGLDPSIVSTFPTFLYSSVKIHRVGKTTPLECAICLSEFADHEILRLLPKCNHVFHPHCIDPWLGSHVTCPVCRANLEIIQAYNNNNSNNQRPFDHHHHQTSEDDEAEPQLSDQTLRQDDVIVRVAASPEMIIKSPTPQEIMKGLSLSESGRIIRLPRSHSTGHSLVGDSDRFTLRLPDEVRNKLVIDNNNYCFSGLPAAIVSPRVGYRAENVGCTGIPGKPDRWRFSMSPPFISRPNSPKLQLANNSSNSFSNSSSNNNNNIMSGGLLRSPKNLLRSIKSPNKSSLQRIVSCNDIGERSSDKLWANRDAQEL